MVTVVASIGAMVACESRPGAGEDPALAENYGGHVHGSPPPPPAPLRAGERFVNVGLAQPYRPVPPQGGTDEYRCFLIDPKFSEASFLTGSQFLPQNGAIVHHAIVYKIRPSDVDRATQVDAATEGDGWQCFGGTGLSGPFGAFTGTGETFIGGWAPGGKEQLLADLAGFPVEPGSQLVLQVHYNLLSTVGRPGPVDQSSLRLRVVPGTADVIPLTAMLLPAPIELPCAPHESGRLCDRSAAIDDLAARTGDQARTLLAGLSYLCNGGVTAAAGPTQHCDRTIRRDAVIYAVAPHMHLLGRSISVELNPGTPQAQMLLDQKVFNFDDQSSVALPEPVRVHSGDTVRVTCTHDATLRSQLPELKPLQPRYVVWGDGTSDEMCLAILTTARV
jgi:hypothetical protein